MRLVPRGYAIKMGISILVSVSVLITMASVADADPASDQLPIFKSKHKCPIGILTTSNGAPVEMRDTTTLDTPDLMTNEFFMDSLSHKLQEKIVQRIVHLRGCGAFGYFEVTHNTTDICGADFLRENGKKTPVMVRFSLANADMGEPDTRLGDRGFACKFYTDEGNFDMVGFHTPMFFYKDSVKFASVTRATKRNPVTNLRDQNMYWGYIACSPESIPFFLYLYGDNGLPAGFTYLPGFSIHTYHVYNKRGKSYYVRWHILPDAGIKNLVLEESKKIGCSDPDYATRALYNSIENGDYPSWTVYLQVLSSKDVKNCKFNPFDVTKTIPEDKYPLRPVGKLVLNRNPQNNFADVEQVAFCPGNLVPGILGGCDNVFTSRRFAYRAAQMYRLGANFQNIKVNQHRNKGYTNNRDGAPPVGINEGGIPNYYPNSFNGPVPYVDNKRPRLCRIKEVADSCNFEQATEMYDKLTTDERKRLVENIVDTLQMASKSVQDKIVALFKRVDPDLALRTIAALTKTRK